MRRAARTDENQAEIVAALRKAGCSVALTHKVASGFPDLVVGRRAGLAGPTSFLLEIKKPGGRLTPDQQEFIAQWRGHYAVVESVEQALEAVGL